MQPLVQRRVGVAGRRVAKASGRRGSRRACGAGCQSNHASVLENLLRKRGPLIHLSAQRGDQRIDANGLVDLQRLACCDALRERVQRQRTQLGVQLREGFVDAALVGGRALPQRVEGALDRGEGGLLVAQRLPVLLHGLGDRARRVAQRGQPHLGHLDARVEVRELGLEALVRRGQLAHVRSAPLDLGGHGLVGDLKLKDLVPVRLRRWRVRVWVQGHGTIKFMGMGMCCGCCSHLAIATKRRQCALDRYQLGLHRRLLLLDLATKVLEALIEIFDLRHAHACQEGPCTNV